MTRSFVIQNEMLQIVQIDRVFYTIMYNKNL